MHSHALATSGQPLNTCRARYEPLFSAKWQRPPESTAQRIMHPHPDRPYLFAEFQVLANTPATVSPAPELLLDSSVAVNLPAGSAPAQPSKTTRRYLRVPGALLCALLILALNCIEPLAAAPHALAYATGSSSTHGGLQWSDAAEDLAVVTWDVAGADRSATSTSIAWPQATSPGSEAAHDKVATAIAETGRGDPALMVTNRTSGFSLQRAFWTLVLVAVMGVCAWLGREEPAAHVPGRG